ncbi:hypothetical protein INE81_02175 [Bacteroides salyersiae]|nr:hypothetical protein INE81_02175 [Bacteroides salyersiae]
MSKYDFIKQGNLLFWHTADNDIECRIISTPEKVDSDSIILISTSSSETEVLASELLPIWLIKKPQRGVYALEERA